MYVTKWINEWNKNVHSSQYEWYKICERVTKSAKLTPIEKCLVSFLLFLFFYWINSNEPWDFFQWNRSTFLMNAMSKHHIIIYNTCLNITFTLHITRNAATQSFWLLLLFNNDNKNHYYYWFTPSKSLWCSISRYWYDFTIILLYECYFRWISID